MVHPTTNRWRLPWLVIILMVGAAACETDTSQCGDAYCNPLGETCLNCPADCGACTAGCGNSTCDAGETCQTCPIDCGACTTACGDGTCDADETCQTCPADCGACPTACGDGTCDADETCQTCPADCGACPAACGDGTCDANESQSTCPEDCDDWPSDWASREDEILVQVNQFRASPQVCGGSSNPAAGTLSMDPELRLAARRHAQDMADHNYFSHTGLNGSSFMDRINATDFSGGCPCGENIAAGNSAATATMTQWINSPGHCENMMGDGYTKIGIGYAYNGNSAYGHYWVQVFAN